MSPELRRKGVTRRLLWLGYREWHPDGYGYSRFCDLHREWEGRLRTTMLQVHRAGERVFVDYAGMTMPVTCLETGEVSQAQIFVATLGASSFTFVEATWSQKSDDFLGSYVRLFEALGGVPDQVVPDNLKAGVSSPGLYELKLNRSYGDLLDHYGTTAVPARARKPRDKTKVETAVRHVERRVLAPLRNRVFLSLADLNAALAPRAADLNASASRHLGASRLDHLEGLDRPALRPRPPHRWEHCACCRAILEYQEYLLANSREWPALPGEHGLSCFSWPGSLLGSVRFGWPPFRGGCFQRWPSPRACRADVQRYASPFGPLWRGLS